MRHAIRCSFVSRRPRQAFTLVEILVAMVVTLIMLGIVVTIFGRIGQSVSASRAVMEMTDQLRATKQRLQLDLAGITVTMLPPRDPKNGEGYFEYIEGPVGRVPAFTINVQDENGVMGPDTTVGDNDDILLFTTQSASEPFVGRNNGAVTTSQVAEVAWFIRGTTLYRRQLLVKPDLNRTGAILTPAQVYSTGQSFYANSDVSVHADGKGTAGSANLGPMVTPGSDPLRIVANSLGDLTKRENRYAHFPLLAGPSDGPTYGWPFDARKYGWFPLPIAGNFATTGRLGLATLQECSDPICPLPIGVSDGGSPASGIAGSRFFPIKQLQLTTASGTEEFDAWENPNPWGVVNLGGSPSYTLDPFTGILNATSTISSGMRVGEDVILTNVLSFDVRVWDPTAPILLDADGTTLLLPGDPCPGYGAVTAAYGMTLQAAASAPAARIVARGAYVDLNYAYDVLLTLDATHQANLGLDVLASQADPRSGLNVITLNGASATYTVPPSYIPAIYDTWSTHYERDGIDQDGIYGADQGTNGVDDNNDGLIDDLSEQEAAPPYRIPLRGLQVKIRCFDPDSKQIREVTVVQEFLPE
ncbi:MAG TPA: prepilin-type N-terminal cleavage/methylation domain-containing protein [Pirellulales bacterium]|jgi:type II secretory pathway pseudopilin PulG